MSVKFIVVTEPGGYSDKIRFCNATNHTALFIKYHDSVEIYKPLDFFKKYVESGDYPWTRDESIEEFVENIHPDLKIVVDTKGDFFDEIVRVKKSPRKVFQFADMDTVNVNDLPYKWFTSTKGDMTIISISKGKILLDYTDNEYVSVERSGGINGKWNISYKGHTYSTEVDLDMEKFPESFKFDNVTWYRK